MADSNVKSLQNTKNMVCLPQSNNLEKNTVATKDPLLMDDVSIRFMLVAEEVFGSSSAVSQIEFPSLIHAADLIPEGYKVVRDVQPTLNLDISKLKFRSFIKISDDQDYINSEEMSKRAVDLLGNLGLVDGKRLLAEQDKIPVDFRGNFYIPFPGTVWCDPNGHLSIPCLFWDDIQWILYFHWLEDDWDGRGRLACSE